MDGTAAVDVLANIMVFIMVPWLVSIERRLSRIEGYLKRVNGGVR